MLELDRLGSWQNLPFFHNDLPAIAGKLTEEVFFPPASRVFAALERCSLEESKVLILGQDPYHTPGKADGLAFSIPNAFNGKLDSLGNIFKELEADLNVPRNNTDLSDWADQGVLLLNTVLTVRSGEANSHRSFGWQELVRQVINELNHKPIAVLLWGGHAQKYAPLLADHHLILQSAHPSPLSAYRGFFGSRPFSKVNQWLKDQGHAPINWANP